MVSSSSISSIASIASIRSSAAIVSALVGPVAFSAALEALVVGGGSLPASLSSS